MVGGINLKGKNFVIAMLFGAILLALIFSPLIGSQTSRDYDPWADINDDGFIGIDDIANSAALFGTSGDPTKPIVVRGYNWTKFSYNFTVHPEDIGYLEIPVSGYKRVSVIFHSNISIENEPLQIRTGFKVNSITAYEDWFSLLPTGVSSFQFHEPNSTWIEPSHISLLNPRLGTRFNVTVWASIDVNTFAWQVRLTFDNRYLEAKRAGYTAVNTSEFFAGHDTISAGPVINNEEGYILYGECLLGNDYKEPDTGTLCWIEFEIKGKPESSVTELIINNSLTYFISPALEKIHPLKYDAQLMVLYNVMKTYTVQGESLVIEYYNPNSNNVQLQVEVYLST